MHIDNIFSFSMSSAKQEKSFVCSVCGLAFLKSSKLKDHVRIHTGEKPFHCETCGKEFARKDRLMNHMHTHIKSNLQVDGEDFLELDT